MGELGQFLENLLRAKAPFQTARAMIREWCGTGPEKQKQYRAWVRYDDRARVECSAVGPKGAYSTLFILAGDAWEYRGPGQAIEQGALDRQRHRFPMPPGFWPIHGMLDRQQIRISLPELSLREMESTVFAGRNCVRVLAEVDYRAHRQPFDEPFRSATRFEFLADPERGLFLRKAAYIDERLIGYREIEEIDFDMPLDEVLFVMPPEVADSKPRRVTRGLMTLKQVIAAAPFTLLLPTGWPEPGHVFFKEPDDQSDAEFVDFGWPNRHYTNMELSRKAVPEMKELVWEDAMAGDRMVRIADMEIDVPSGGGMKVILMELGGTFAMIGSLMPREELLKFAGSLRAVEKDG